MTLSLPRARRSRPRIRPGVEVLEDRCTPATLTVNGTADTNLSDAILTLREAVALVNAGGDANAALGRALSTEEANQITDAFGTADTIQFAASLTGGTITLGSQLSLTRAVDINGGTTGLTLFGNNASRLFEIDDLNLGTSQTVRITALNLSGGNGSGGDGGAISNVENLTLTACTLSANISASFGGAIRNHNFGTLTLTNCTLSGNRANAAGGAIYNAGSLTITNSTITGNHSDNNDAGDEVGGGIGTFGGFVSSTTTLFNTIVAGNFKGSGTGTANDLGEKDVEGASTKNLVGDATSAGGLINNANNIVGVAVSTVLDTTLASNGGPTQTHALIANSPAINAGSNTAATNAGLTSDQRSQNPRIVAGTVDIGAFEFLAAYANSPIVVDNGGDGDDNNFASGQLTLREAILIANARAGADTITFANGITTLTLSTGQLQLTDSAMTTIDGGSAGATIQRSTAPATPSFRIFLVLGGTAEFRNLTITRGADFGAGIFNSNGTVRVVGSTITENVSQLFGGGVLNIGGTLTVTNATISGNTAQLSGGGISNLGTLTVTNSTITGNRSDSDGNGVGDGGGIAASGDVTLRNTIVAGNFKGPATTPDDLAPLSVDTAQNNLIGDAATSSGIAHNVDGNIVGVAVGAVLNTTLANNGGPTPTHALVANSPAINKGSNTAAAGLARDQRQRLQYPRIIAGTVDIGAFEFLAPFSGPLVVNNPGDGDDNDFGAGQLTLREAILIANQNPSADIITFAGITTVTLTTAHLQLTDPEKTTIDGGISGVTVQRSTTAGTPNFRIFDVFGGTVDFLSLTITNGAGDLFGTGIINSGGTVTITNSTITRNTSTLFGGGVYNTGTTTIRSSTISNNSATQGAGGLRNEPVGLLTVINSTITLNTTSANGGGVNNGGTMSVINSTISGNSAAGFGGGLRNAASGTVTVINSTITGNRANSDDTGTETGGGISAPGNDTLRNSIVAGNFVGSSGTTADDIGGDTINTAANNLIGDFATRGGIEHNSNGNLVGNSGAGTLDITTVLSTTLASNGGPTQTHGLVANSPALNAGNDTLAVDAQNNPLAFDQRGPDFVRKLGVVDIGAFEGVLPALPPAPVPAPAPSRHPTRIDKVTSGKGKTKKVTLNVVTAAGVVLRSFKSKKGEKVALQDKTGDGVLDVVITKKVGRKTKVTTLDGTSL